MPLELINKGLKEVNDRKYPTEKTLKKQIKELKAKYNLKTHEAYEHFSKNTDNSTWRTLKPKLEAYWKSIDATVLIDVAKPETNGKQLNLVKLNKIQLTQMGVEFSTFEPTITGLKKSILDATQQVRTHFELENFHFYYSQTQGNENKIIKTAHLLTTGGAIKSKVSLYRPNTKNGDPRMWFRKLGELAVAGDQVAIIIFRNEPYLINLSKTKLSDVLLNKEHPISELLNQYIEANTSVSKELMLKLKELAKSPFKALRKGDTAIGYTLETLLGIEANSSKLPDYKGIELKAGRSNKTRTNLFAQVADWNISPCKRSADILEKFGYERGDDFKLYCTISTINENSQGLSFKYDKNNDQLVELFKKKEVVAIWLRSTIEK
ncbi:MvaI/BcnI family restriction endonuclease [Psychrosphaera algicola]|uniref:MvaI/BcnI family restriction endonuclease n=1 Tax=Psychrosphaera algicola TaxID=3023714 RepID=A0ABT5FAZ4_9GAMM|nr:MvaI/BcnI family restriction endonuclease [Psychrosphaera sp. G1-22]MDC2888702.1 MvaI/BcnI family restriction endonuclease [Psychrosphaera sp. G1-22]